MSASAGTTGDAMIAMPRLGCGAAIVIDHRILLIRRLKQPEAGHWGLPGGKIDLFETCQHAVQREVAEELGLNIDPQRLLCVVDQIDAVAGSHWVAPVYLVQCYDGTPRLMEPDKHDAFGWFPLDALPAPLTISARAAVAAISAVDPAKDPPDQTV